MMIKRVALLLVASSLTFIHAGRAAAQSTVQSFGFTITYDPSSHIYLLESGEKLRHMIYPDGSVDFLDSSMSPFDFRKSVGIGFNFVDSPTATRLHGRVGVVAEGQGFYALGADGHHAVRNLYENSELPCERLDPRDFCVLYGSGQSSNHHFVFYLHRSLGFQLAHWNGSAYESPDGPLAGLSGDEDGFTLIDEASIRLFSIGASGNYLYLSQDFASPAAPAPLELLADGGRRPVEMPWPAQFSTADMRSLRAIGTDVFALFSAYSLSTPKALAFRVSDAGGGVAEVEDLSAILGNDAAAVHWLGIDENGKAYAFHSQDRRIMAVDLVNRQITDVGPCQAPNPPSAFVTGRSITAHDPTTESGVWIFCGTNLIGLRDGAIVTSVDLRAGITRAHLVSTVGQPVEALVAYSDGTVERLNHGARVPVTSLGVFAPGASALASEIQWEDGQKFCRRQSSVAGQGIRSYVACLDRGAWREQIYGIEVPIDIFESVNATWALSQRNGVTRLARRTRQRSAHWQTVAEFPGSTQSQSSRFIPTSASDEIGLYIPGLGIYRFSPTTGAVQLPVDATVLDTKYRPALADGGWLYAFCKVDGSPPAPNAMVEICVFNPSGQRTALGQVLETALASSVTNNGFVPLGRGVMFAMVERVPDTSTVKPRPMVVFQTRMTLLATLFGEFRYSTAHPWSLRVWSSPDGAAYILKSDEFVVGKDLYDRAYKFDGRHLEVLATVSQPESGSFSSFSTGFPSTGRWTPLTQIWTGKDGIWRRNATTGSEEPIRVDLSPTTLMMNSARSANLIQSAAKNDGGEAILANDSGFWFCRENETPKIGADTWRIRSHPSCAHSAFVGLPRQIALLADQTILALSGRELVAYDRDHQIATSLAENVMSSRFTSADGHAWFATAAGLHSLDLSNRRERFVRDLPAGVTGQDVYLATATYLCTSKGLYHWAGSAPSTWALILPKCDTATVVGSEESLYVVHARSLYKCVGASCLVSAAVPRPEVDSTTLGMQDDPGGDLLIAQGKEVFRLEGDSFRKCDMRWGYGALPKVNITDIHTGLAITAGGGVLGALCSEETAVAVYRLH